MKNHEKRGHCPNLCLMQQDHPLQSGDCGTINEGVKFGLQNLASGVDSQRSGRSARGDKPVLILKLINKTLSGRFVILNIAIIPVTDVQHRRLYFAPEN